MTRGVRAARPAIFEHQFGARRLDEFLAFADRHHEGARAADHAILVIDIEVFDIHRAGIGRLSMIGKPLMVMPAASTSSRVGTTSGAGIVGAVARHIDDAAQPAIAAVVEQRLGKTQRAGNRGARGTPIRRARNFGGDRVGRFRPFDQPPRHDDLLVELARPIRNK